MTTQPLIYIVAGEPSGDQLGASLMRALRRLTAGRIAFAGVGGEQMAQEGLQSLFPIADIAVMGLLEVLPRAPLVLRRVRDTVDAIVKARPAALVTIDSSGFTFRLAKRVRAAAGKDVPLIHYVAPQVWAWRASKARSAARIFDHLMVLLPFEPPYFEKEGLATTYVGHPAIEAVGRGDAAAFRRRHRVGAETVVLGLLPGSRRGQLRRHLPIFAEAARLLLAEGRRLHAVVPAVRDLAGEVAAVAAAQTFPITTVGLDEKYDAFAACEAAIAASGTVTLELALAGVPFITAYRVNALSAMLARRLIHVNYATLANILLQRPLVPEFVLDRCYPAALAGGMRALLEDEAARARQREGFAELRRILGDDGPPPSERAARTILALIRAASVTDAGAAPVRTRG